MNITKKFLMITLFAMFAIVICVRWVDYPLALAVSRVLLRHRIYITKTTFPDLLLPGSLILITIAWTSYRYCIVANRLPSIVPLFKKIGIVLPIVYIVKEFAQYCFGRVSSRAILLNPDLQQFCFFHENLLRGGFPSGHMMIATPLLLVLSRYYSTLRPLWFGLGIALGASLVLTDYHFLGDVIAGAYGGFVVERIVVGFKI